MLMNSEYKSSEGSASERVSDTSTQDPDQTTHSTTEEGSPACIEMRGGPRSQQGKAKSKHNALRHGLFSSVILLKGQSQAELNALLRGLRNDLKPERMLEKILVDKLAALLWRHRRLMNVIVEGERPKKGIEALVSTDFSEIVPTPLDLSARYESTLERSFERALNQLERLQRTRKGQALPPTLNVNVST
jgi:hypothetical protein